MDARRVTRRVAAMLVLGVTMTLVAPGRAAASSYRWTHDGNGSWTTSTNWQHLSGPVGSGYPNAAGDLAIFDNPFTANRTVTINQGVTVGIISVSETQNISFFTSGAGAIIFRAASGSTTPPAVEVFDTGQLVIGVPIILAGDLRVLVSASACRVSFTAGLSQDGTARAFTKRGAGTVYFFSLNPNTYTGTTHVLEGTLELQHLGGALALNGPLYIGGSTSPTSTATVLLREDNQIVDTAGIRVDDDGSFLVSRFDETIGSLLLLDGYTSVGSLSSAGRLSVGDVAMSGGSIELASGSDLVLRGNLLAGSTALSSSAGLTGVGRVLLNGATRTFDVADGPDDVDLLIEVAIVGTTTEGWTKSGAGTARFSNSAVNSYPGSTNVTAGRLELARGGSGRSIPTSLYISGSSTAIAEVRDVTSGNFAPGANVGVSQFGLLTMTDAVETIDSLLIASTAATSVGGTTGSRLTVRNLSVLGGRLDILPSSIVTLGETLTAQSLPSASATIAGGGRLQLTASSHQFNVHDGQHAIDLVIATEITGELNARISKVGPGVARLDGTNSYGGTSIFEGTLLVNGAQPDNAVQISGGTLGGHGQVGVVGPGLPGSSVVAPGMSPGILTTRSIRAALGFRLAVEITGTTPGSGYDQLKVVGVVVIESATLQIDAPPGFVPPGLARFVIVDNDGSDPVVGTFFGLAEGARVRINDDHEMTISYVGGDGNDVVLTSTTPPSYFLAEGATGGFFDDDVLIANPNTTAAPVTLTFLQEGGGTVVEHRTLAPQSRMTVHVDQIAGLENASPSVQVTSDAVLPLVVERTMFWDASYYGGHTANAVTQPQTTWVFAEGFQGFFDTYILIANANADATTATITFLRENDTPVVKTVPVAAFARRTVYAGDYTELLGRAFGIVVSATLPVIAERAMYFASIPGRLWTGGHANTGIAAASTSWFQAEGATGGFFNTFILLSNPQDTDARVDLQFLLDNGEVIARQKTIGARQRLTINPAAEGDARLENAAVSTIVSSDVPIVSERSMYWPGDAAPFGEGHNSAGVIDTATRWGLAEGRVGGSHQFATYILLANPQTTAAEVTITYLREGGAAPIAKTYTVPPTSRFNVDVGGTVTELRDESFGARIEVTNGVPIAVERSLYWNANGVFWAGGTNALATPLP